MRDSKQIIAELDQRDLLEDAQKIALEHVVSVDALCSSERYACAARYAFWRWLVEMYSFSLPRVGALFGVHHTTVLYGVRIAQGLPGKGVTSAKPIVSDNGRAWAIKLRRAVG